MNKVLIGGKISRGPIAGETEKGVYVVNFDVETIETWKDKASGENQKKSEFHKCTQYGELARMSASRIKPGMFVIIEGRLMTAIIDGNYSSQIKIQTIEFVK